MILAFGVVVQSNNELPSLGLLIHNEKEARAQIVTLRHRQSLKRNSLLKKMTWKYEDTYELETQAVASLRKLAFSSKPALFIEWEMSIAVVQQS